ncbi:hypothetical protein GCM10009647_046170 [Streptomyces sanglieri]
MVRTGLAMGGTGSLCVSGPMRGARCTESRGPVPGRGCQQVFGLGFVRTGRLPGHPRVVPVAVAPPVPLTAARQFRIRTGFPDP